MPARPHVATVARSVSIESLEPRRLLAFTLPAGFVQTQVGGPVPSGSLIDVAPDGKLFVVEQAGRIQVYSGHTSQAALLQPNFFRDAPPNVNFSEERGMFGLAFDPNYASNRFVYVHYTLDAFPFPGRISRFTANAAGDLALPGSELVLLTLEAPNNSNHNGGAIHFGPDGKLYVAVGDSSIGAHAQSITTLKGKVLRMNTTPGDIVPPDNPPSIDGIAGTTSGIHRLIWAAGLRNPFTFAIQPGTGRMFVNDVGEAAWEEINDAAPGRNFGWPATEGDFDQGTFPNFTRPFFTYHHLNGKVAGRAIAGGAFYNPPVHSFPPDYAGDYFFGDFVEGWIKRIDTATKQTNDFVTWDDDTKISNLALAPDGSLLYVTYDGTNGRAYRVHHDNVAPAVVTSAFEFDGVTLPDPPHRLRFAFSEDVSASLSVADLVLENLTTGGTVPGASISLSYDIATNTATFTFPGFSDAVLPDGRYRATLLAAGITDAAGNPLGANVVFNFFMLSGDANHDGVVNLGDFNILATNFGQPDRIFSQGDFNYDGTVNLHDFNILAGRFGYELNDDETFAHG